MTIGVGYMHLLCLTCDAHLRAKFCLCGVETIAAYGASHGALCVDVHSAIYILRTHIAVVAGGAVLGVCTTMAAVDDIV